MNIYLIKRGPRPDYHRAPFHPVIICARRNIAREEAGDSNAGVWMWENTGGDHHGFLLLRWNGLDVDYGYVVKGITLPDGTVRAFDHEWEHPETWALLNGATWWSPKKMPPWLVERGVCYPGDSFSQQEILNQHANDGWTGIRRALPPWWQVEGAL